MPYNRRHMRRLGSMIVIGALALAMAATIAGAVYAVGSAASFRTINPERAVPS